MKLQNVKVTAVMTPDDVNAPRRVYVTVCNSDLNPLFALDFECSAQEVQDQSIAPGARMEMDFTLSVPAPAPTDAPVAP